METRVRSPGFGPDIVIAFPEDALFAACRSLNSELIVFHIDKALLVRAGTHKMRWGGRPARVRFAPKATVSDRGATCRDGPISDSCSAANNDARLAPYRPRVTAARSH